MAAPCKATPEVVAEVAKRVAEGMPVSHAAALVRVVPATISNWMKRKEFSVEVARARAKFMQEKLEIISEAGRNKCNNGFMQWQAAAWLLERSFPEDFALQARSSGSGPGFTLNIKLAGGERLQIKAGDAQAALPGRSPIAIEGTISGEEGPL